MALMRIYKAVLFTMFNVWIFATADADVGSQTEQLRTNQTESGHSKIFQKPAFSARTMTIFNPQNMESKFFEIHTPDEIIVFDEIITNTGSHYSSVTGIFVAPSADQYFFATSVKDVSNRDGTTLHIVHNGRRVAEISAVRGANLGQEPQGSNSVVLELSAGDEVAVRSFNAGGKVIGSFTGFKI
ncbi:cerebellin-2-like [Mercenaria mercenaria]|uniref:cerebellin-2-like n=1 Tax=Mercenaria mercenaria TaxID=6596 RepID=UPI001E1DA09C|nr:cerebellin-2-like [Mercenaria mercenaria]